MDIRHNRRAAVVLTAGALFLPLAGCTAGELSTDTSATTAAEDAVESATSAAESAAANVDGQVDCSGTSCTVTLSPDAGSVEILGTTVAYEGVENGEATLTVGNQTVTCAEGDTVEAGPLSLACTTVTDDSIMLTAGLG